MKPFTVHEWILIFALSYSCALDKLNFGNVSGGDYVHKLNQNSFIDFRYEIHITRD